MKELSTHNDLGREEDARYRYEVRKNKKWHNRIINMQLLDANVFLYLIKPSFQTNYYIKITDMQLSWVNQVVGMAECGIQ